MGFSRDTAVTVDADLFAYGAEQQVTNLLVESGKTDWSDVHKAAVNVLIVDLKSSGYNPASISNTEDFEAELSYWVLWRIWLAEAAAGRAGAPEKADLYRALWETARASRYIELTDGTESSQSNPLPSVTNMDDTFWFGPDANGARYDPCGGYQNPLDSGGIDSSAVRNRPI